MAARMEAERGTLWTTVITVAELSYGAAKSHDPHHGRQLVVQFLLEVRLLGLTIEGARIFGDLKALLERQGRKLADADLFIAAICLEHGATLVTGNRRHFDRIPGLAIENWIDGSVM